MKMLVLVVSLVLVFGFLAGGCSSGGGGSGAGTCLTCEAVKTTGTGWCDACGSGMVDGRKITCPGCYAAKTGGPACPICSR